MKGNLNSFSMDIKDLEEDEIQFKFEKSNNQYQLCLFNNQFDLELWFDRQSLETLISTVGKKL